MPIQFDIRAILKSKAPKAHVPDFLIRYLERITHIKEMNAFLRRHRASSVCAGRRPDSRGAWREGRARGREFLPRLYSPGGGDTLPPGVRAAHPHEARPWRRGGDRPSACHEELWRGVPQVDPRLRPHRRLAGRTSQPHQRLLLPLIAHSVVAMASLVGFPVLPCAVA